VDFTPLDIALVLFLNISSTGLMHPHPQLALAQRVELQFEPTCTSTFPASSTGTERQIGISQSQSFTATIITPNPVGGWESIQLQSHVHESTVVFRTFGLKH